MIGGYKTFESKGRLASVAYANLITLFESQFQIRDTLRLTNRLTLFFSKEQNRREQVDIFIQLLSVKFTNIINIRHLINVRSVMVKMKTSLMGSLQLVSVCRLFC